MSFYNTILGLLNKVYRDDEYIQSLLSAIDASMLEADSALDATCGNLFFDTLDEDGCGFFEKDLAITPKSGQTIADRRASIQAKWQSANHNSIELVQDVCNAWKNGEIEADFVNGKIQLKFVGSFGVPGDMEGLQRAVDMIKPAHLAYFVIYRYLLIKDIHEVMTLEQLEQITIDQLAFGVM